MCFGPFRYSTKLGAKWVKLVQVMQKFVPRKCVGIFRDKRTQSTPLHPKHMFWCILYSLGAFRTILLLYETNFKTGRTGAINAKVRAMKSCRNFSQRTHLTDPIVPQTIVIVHFIHFGCVSDHFVTARNSAQNWSN